MKTAVLKVLAYAILLTAFTGYLYAMVVDPLLVGGWERLHKVWFDWQTFNSAMIALFAALIGLAFTIRLTKSQNKSQFTVARAQLPEALALVGGYLDKYLLVLEEALEKLGTPAGNRQALNAVSPTLDIEYKLTFGTCIAHGPNDLRFALTEITKQLQIHKSRMSSLVEQEFQPNSKFAIAEILILSQLKAVCKTRAHINKLYPYARFESEKVDTMIEDADILNSACNLDGNVLNKLNNYLGNKAV